MNVRLTQLDGALPNLALMKLAAWHKANGDAIHVTRDIERGLFEPNYGRVYGSAIFKFSQARLMRFQRAWPGAEVGGTGTPFVHTIEDEIGEDFDLYDYSGYPDFEDSIGYTQRGCRLKCKFCVVPTKEGKNRPEATIASIWRGPGHPRKLHLLDNDFFGNPEWRDRIAELREGKGRHISQRFRVCLSQGINVRLINEEAAAALATIEYRNTKFNERKLYTAWDNLGDERVFFKGVDTLERAGIPPTHLMAYMLIGFDPKETWEAIWHRWNLMVARGIEPYPMVYDQTRKDLRCIARWAATGLYRVIPWDKYEQEGKSAESVEAWKRAA